MVVRATVKLHNIARITPVKMDVMMDGPLPGEWYASSLSTGRKGGSAIHFLHIPTMVSVLVLGRSLTKAVELLPVRAAALLYRNGFSELIPRFELESEPVIVSTNSRSVLANMNRMKFDVEYNLAMEEVLEPADMNRIEDALLKYLFGGKIAKSAPYNVIRPVDQLKILLSDKA